MTDVIRLYFAISTMVTFLLLTPYSIYWAHKGGRTVTLGRTYYTATTMLCVLFGLFYLYAWTHLP